MLRVAIVGLGWWGRHMVRRLAPSDKVEIVRAVDTRTSAAAEFAAEHGLPLTGSLDEVLADPTIDAVLLCTPHSLHTDQVAAVAAAGKHVFCEKPLALTQHDAEQSVAACQAAGLVLGIGHERRFEPAMREVQRLVESGELGTIMHVESNFSHDRLANVPDGNWRTSSKESPAAGMTAMGIHLTDAYLGLFGPVREVHAMTARRVLPFENGDVVSVMLRFASGATGFVSAILKTPHYLRLAVFGADAWVEVHNHTHPDTPGPATLTLHRSDTEPIQRDYPWLDTVRANVEAFADAIAGNANYPFTDAEKIANIAILEAVTRSATTGAAVAVDRVWSGHESSPSASCWLLFRTRGTSQPAKPMVLADHESLQIRGLAPWNDRPDCDSPLKLLRLCDCVTFWPNSGRCGRRRRRRPRGR